MMPVEETTSTIGAGQEKYQQKYKDLKKRVREVEQVRQQDFASNR